MNDEIVRQKYGMLYNDYNSNFYFWELIRIYMKNIIILVLLYWSQSYIVKGCLAFLTIYLYIILCNKYNPYNFRYFNQLEQESSYITALTVLVCIFLSDNNIAYFRSIGFVLIIVINTYFILKFLWIILPWSFKSKFFVKVDSINKWIYGKFKKNSKSKVSPSLDM